MLVTNVQNYLTNIVSSTLLGNFLPLRVTGCRLSNIHSLNAKTINRSRPKHIINVSIFELDSKLGDKLLNT